MLMVGHNQVKVASAKSICISCLADAVRWLRWWSRHETLRESCQRDAGTGCYRRWYGEELGQQILSSGLDLALVIVDIDHFKSINDEHGHIFGDHVLRQMGDLLQQELRNQDRVVRFGGDEFMLLLPATSPQGLHAVLHKVQNALKARRIG